MRFQAQAAKLGLPSIGRHKERAKMGTEPGALPVKGKDEKRVPTENDVVWNGEIVGSDPDEEVRQALLKDAQSGSGDNG